MRWSVLIGLALILYVLWVRRPVQNKTTVGDINVDYGEPPFFEDNALNDIKKLFADFLAAPSQLRVFGPIKTTSGTFYPLGIEEAPVELAYTVRPNA